MKNHILKITLLSFFLILISCDIFREGVDCGDIDTTATTPESSDFKDVIEQFNSSYSNLNSTNEFVNNTNVYVDLSDGITKYALGNSNNKKLLQQFFLSRYRLCVFLKLVQKSKKAISRGLIAFEDKGAIRKLNCQPISQTFFFGYYC